MRRVAWVAVFAATFALLAVAALDGGGVETDGERIERLSESLACPQCQGESVAESNAAVAVTIRDYIRGEVGDGATDQEIRDDLIRAYGASVLLTPPAEGLAALLWVLPVVLVVAGAAAVAAVIGRSSRSSPVTEADRALVAAAREERGSDRS
ncbi:MAG: cytochrome c-type biogenesis protein CcmH [Acidimicrobiales bacterium]